VDTVVLEYEIACGDQTCHLLTVLTCRTVASPPLLDGRNADTHQFGDVSPSEPEVGKLVEHLLSASSTTLVRAAVPLDIVASVMQFVCRLMQVPNLLTDEADVLSQHGSYNRCLRE
jgi:hypothetical protein